MPGAKLLGWDSENNKWIPLVCNTEGKLIIDPSEILEDTPTNNEVGKAPTSNWAYDHNADASAHHTKTTAGELNHNDLANISSDDHHTKTTAGELNHNDLANIGASDHHSRYTDSEANSVVQAAIESTPTNGEQQKTACSNWSYDHNANPNAHHIKYTDTEALAVMVANLEETPTNGEDEKAPTSNWAYDHAASSYAHHFRYSDAEAVSAVATADDYLKNDGDTASGNYNFDSGTLYIDSSNNRVGVGDTTPSYTLDVTGTIRSTKGRYPAGYMEGQGGYTEDDVFDAMSPDIPNTNDVIVCNGYLHTGSNLYLFQRAKRQSSTVVRLYGYKDTIVSTYYDMTSGSGTSLAEFGITW